MKIKSFQPCIDLLEERATPAAGFSLSQGVLSITGDNGKDHVTVNYSTNGTAQTADDRIEVTRLQQSGYSNFASYARASVQRVDFFGLGGNDTFLNNAAVPSIARGGEGYDYLRGGSKDDILDGDNGNDTLIGGAGHDQLFGDAGIDRLLGLAGNDKLYGGAGDDWLYGGAGDDALYGQSGRDSLYGDDFGAIGKDILDGGYDSIIDYVVGGRGKDIFRIHRFGPLAPQPEWTPDFNWIEIDTRLVIVHTTLP